MHGPMIRVGLFGFGRAGKAVAEELVKDQQITLVWVAKRASDIKAGSVSEFLQLDVVPEGEFISTEGLTAAQLFRQHPVDFVVDFSSEASIDYYGLEAANSGAGIVSAISHYDEARRGLLRRLGQQVRVLHSPNMTVGINFLMVASKALRRIAPHSDVEVIEQHFRGKGEVSGTAMRIAECLDLDSDNQVNSIRVGGIVGKHEVIFGFPYQVIRLVHETILRNAFGQGAIYAVKKLHELGNGFHTMEGLMAKEFRAVLAELEAVSQDAQSEPLYGPDGLTACQGMTTCAEGP